MQNIKITSPEELALHAFISLVAGALLAGVTAVGGVIYTHGINIPIMLTAGIGGFGTAFGAGFLAFRNSPDAKQAEVDLAGQATQVATSVEARLVPQIEARFQGVINWLEGQSSQAPAQVQVQPQVQVQAPSVQPIPPMPVQVQQQPFPAQSTFPVPIVPKQP